jgi:hypothetical protein
MGHVRVACTSCRDEFGQTVFFEPPHHRGHQALAGWVAGPVPLEYSIEWLTCAVASRFDAVMVG